MKPLLMVKCWCVVVGSCFLTACLHLQTSIPVAKAGEAIAEKAAGQAKVKLAKVDEVLSQRFDCNATITIRSQALTQQVVDNACKALISQEDKFHQLFSTRGKPVADDYNHSLRANFYHNRDEYVKYATAHFNMPSDNGGMYLEGFPDNRDNHAEFVAYESNGVLWNLEHEYVHYLDSRFNRYGDFCNGLHDDHSGPEFCPKPNLDYPHGVWWSEGIAEYIARGDKYPKAQQLAASKSYRLSELFNTSYNHNNGSERIYQWGYLAVRFMMEHHRGKVEQTLAFTRQGDWQGYQALLRSWSTSLDKQWFIWLEQVAKK